LKAIEQPSLDIVQIEESNISDKQAFVTYVVEISWINPKTWEEHLEHGAMSLNLSKKRDNSRKRDNWLVSGFTFARRPQVDNKFDDITDVTDPRLPPPRFGIDSLFSFWY
jgi:hypothetical protein